ncbi:hypothetical protein QUH73_14865 [Labilibaculum sp. K2S]|uniref:hypothetical protein n=1 Tax=Labilibaculum sp. K2S TaxID=3056386 RepID=UPI0025A411D0|nr:hypothetical protein [Labilibaculum sp. K2S]MDM8161104.1 hypothetical protein [Labilibaculum sp. K2S]
MKMKSLFLILLMFSLVGCPIPESDRFEINSFKAEITTINGMYELSEKKSIKWEDFAIQLSFKTKEVYALHSVGLGKTCYAARSAEPELRNKILKATIQASSKYNDILQRSNLDEILIPKVAGLERSISLTEACEFMASSSYSNSNNDEFYHGGYFRLTQSPNSDFTGKFYISLEFEDGSILQDSTQTVTITSK